MSEYWKSTPKYWCKHCKTFVKDTPIEKKNHEATGKHQGNLQRFIRTLHKDNERDERDKLRAKNEVNRLNGVPRTSFAPSGSVSSAPSLGGGSGGNNNMTPADRKRQLQQLADMGIAVPEDFRKETAMAGEWEVTSRRVIYEQKPEPSGMKKEEDADSKNSPVVSFGVRKRKHEDEEEEEALGSRAPRKGWGGSVRSMPGASGGDELDALLSQTKPKVNLGQEAPPTGQDPVSAVDGDAIDATDNGGTASASAIKQEQGEIEVVLKETSTSTIGSENLDAVHEATPQIKGEEDAAPAVIFKKRKPKIAR